MAWERGGQDLSYWYCFVLMVRLEQVLRPKPCHQLAKGGNCKRPMHAECKSMQNKIKEEVNPILPFHRLKLGLIYSQYHTILDVVDEHDQKQIAKIDPQTGHVTCEYM